MFLNISSSQLFNRSVFDVLQFEYVIDSLENALKFLEATNSYERMTKKNLRCAPSPPGSGHEHGTAEPSFGAFRSYAPLRYRPFLRKRDCQKAAFYRVVRRSSCKNSILCFF